MATEISTLTADVFSLFDRDWALLTAGTIEEGFNAMTISWGQLGSLWGNPGKAKSNQRNTNARVSCKGQNNGNYCPCKHRCSVKAHLRKLKTSAYSV